MVYDFSADSTPISSITIKLILYNPGLLNVWYNDVTLYTGSSKSERFQIICIDEEFPSGSKDRLSNIYSVST